MSVDNGLPQGTSKLSGAGVAFMVHKRSSGGVLLDEAELRRLAWRRVGGSLRRALHQGVLWSVGHLRPTALPLVVRR